jgi:hypothetical protein
MRKSSTLKGMIVVLALILGAGLAFADKVDDLISQLKTNPDYKVRLSAALNLGKIGDKRAIPALTDALSDADKTVRGVAAAALGKMVDGTVDATVRNRAISELDRVAQKDTDSFVRSQAQKSHAALKGLSGSGGSTPSSGGKPVYVAIGPMADSTKTGGSILPLMQKTVADTVKKNAPGFQVKTPSATEMKQAGAVAFWVDGTLIALTVKQEGATASVTCNMSVIVATYPDKSMFGFAKGGATVQTGNVADQIATAKEDCVGAVLEDVVRRQVVPTIQQRVP